MIINNIEIKNAIFTNMTITNKIENYNSSTLPIVWDSNTLFNCDFNTLFGGDPAAFNVENISKVLVRKRINGTNNWITIVNRNVYSFEDLIFKVKDYLSRNYTNYDYAVVEIDNSGNEGTYYINTILSQFDDDFICNQYKVYPLTDSTSYNSMNRNIEVGSYQTFGRKYPITVMNGVMNYTSMTTSAYLIKDENSQEINRLEQIQYENEVLDFLTNRKPKIFKDMNGRIYMINIIGSPSLSPISELGNALGELEFEWNEIGDMNSQSDLERAGLLPIKVGLQK